MTIILHKGRIHIAYSGPYPWSDGALEKANASEDGFSFLVAPDAEYLEGDEITDWDLTSGIRLVPRVVVEPVRSEREILEAELSEKLSYLSSTDWYVVRFVDDGTEIPEEVRLERSASRQRISEIREHLGGI